jgi:ribonuclease Z
MRVIFLGTSGGLPTPRRALPAVAVLRGGEMLLFDCGEGTQQQIMRKGLGFGRLTKIFISHLHGDHLSGLMGLLMTLTLLERNTPLDIYGPPELQPFFESLKRDIKLRTRFDLSVYSAAPGIVVREDEYFIEAAPLMHSAPCLAFALQEKPRPGRFNVARALELGVLEGPMFGQLQRGETITLEDGRAVSPADVLGPARSGRRLVYATDTCYYPGIIPFCRNADLLIHEGMFTNDMEDEARIRRHCTAAQAASIAKEAGAKRLVITHLSARHSDTRCLCDEARAVFPDAEVAHDLMEMEIPYED